MELPIALEQVCAIVANVWDISVLDIVHLVGYDVINFRVTAGGTSKDQRVANTSSAVLGK
jgi:hypothetical protein